LFFTREEKQMKAVQRRVVLAMFLGFAVLFTGCGSGKTKVSGTVTSQGKKVVWGTVILMDSKGEVHQGRIKLDGTYSIDNVPIGGVKIAVTSPPPPGSAPGGRGAPGAAGAKGANKGMGGAEDPREKFLRENGGKQEANDEPPPPGVWFAINPKFYDHSSSGLTGEVKSGVPLDIDLK
jgi:hypothetical protein